MPATKLRVIRDCLPVKVEVLPPKWKDPSVEKEREAALKRLEEESRKPAAERRPPEYGSDKDFPLQQALAKLKGQPVKVSKTLVERKDDTKTE